MNNLVKCLFVAFLISMGFIPWGCSMTRDQALSDEAQACYGFINDIGKILGKKYHLSPCGVGAGVDQGIWLMSLSFQRYGSSFTEEEARQLIINCLCDFLEAANLDEDLRPFLKNYPFQAENVDMAIFSFKEDRREMFDPWIGTVSASRGKVSYYTFDELNPYQYKTERTEAYHEAIDRLGKQESRS